MSKILFFGHLGNIHKRDDELVHVSPTRSREMAAELSKVGHNVTCAVYWPEAEQEISPTLRYIHLDKIEADDYEIVFCHLKLAIDQITDLARGKSISRDGKYGKDQQRFKKLLAHPRMYLQLDAPRPLDKDRDVSTRIANHIKCVGVATQNAVSIWNRMHPDSKVEWVNAATIAHKYSAKQDPYPASDKKKVVYLGRMNDASATPPIEKLHQIAKRLPDVDFHIITNKIRDKHGNVLAINELQTGSARDIRFNKAQELVRLGNVHLHRGSKYSDSFDWMHYADCAIGFAVRPDQDVASCKSWEYYGTGIPVVLEEGTPETWILDQMPQGQVAKFQDWDDFAAKIQLVLSTEYKRRKMRNYISANHGYDSRAKQWSEIFEQYK